MEPTRLEEPMRNILLFVVLTMILVSAGAPSFRAADKTPGGVEMTTYYVGFLHRGPKWTPEQTPEVEKLQQAHMDNIRRLGESGKLILAGPFSDDGELRGMFIFQVSSLEEARDLCETDPAVKAGRLRVELHPWFAPRGIRVERSAAGPKP